MQPIPGLDPQPQAQPKRRVTAGIQVQDGGGWRVIIGLLIVGYGLLLTASNLDNDQAYRILERWYFPTAMIAIGLYRSWRASTGLGRLIGGFIALLGIWWTICELFGLRFHIWDWWPLVLVGFGAVMIYRATQRSDSSSTAEFVVTAGFPSTPAAAESTASTATSPSMPGGAPASADAGPISAFAFWSGVHKRVSAAFKRATLAAFMGGIEFDLRPAVTVGGQAVVEVFVLMGGLEITVPPDWTVTNEALVIMGGIDDRSSGTPGATQILVIRGLILMGGVEIKT
jgi:hypothetical protein